MSGDTLLMWRWLFVACLVVACTKRNDAVDCSDGGCSDPNFPFCDVDGLFAEPLTCVAATCTPGEILGCRGEQALQCNADGDGVDAVACGGGACVDGAAPHCPYLQPRYLPDVCDTLAEQSALEFTNSGDFDPNLDTNCTGGIVDQPGAPSICVVRYASISVGSNATLRMTGLVAGMGRVIALVADNTIRIEGTLNISARGSLSGPGGGKSQSGAIATVNNGGGGAGGATAGGTGSIEAVGGGLAANGGATTPDPAVLQALVGGHAAGQLVVQDTNGVDVDFGGGGGGGGITLISCRGSVDISGTILAGGGGGLGGAILPTNGFGGGAGGNVVLQGVAINVTGQLFSNGGGGGSGRTASGTQGLRGSDGSASAAVAANGGTSLDGSGGGGAGGIAGTPPSNGAPPINANAGAGGGGGSVGFLQTYTPQGVTPNLAGSVSPPFGQNGAIPTR